MNIPLRSIVGNRLFVGFTIMIETEINTYKKVIPFDILNSVLLFLTYDRYLYICTYTGHFEK